MELYQDIEEFTIKLTKVGRKISYQNKNINKVIEFVYTDAMKFQMNTLIAVNGGTFSKGFLENHSSFTFYS